MYVTPFLLIFERCIPPDAKINAQPPPITTIPSIIFLMFTSLKNSRGWDRPSCPTGWPSCNNLILTKELFIEYPLPLCVKITSSDVCRLKASLMCFIATGSDTGETDLPGQHASIISV